VRPLVTLSAWPTPYRGGGELSITFATSSGVGGGSRPAEVNLYDVQGRLVRRITNGQYVAGYHRAVWDGRDARGGVVASGVYFLVSRSAGEERRLKLVIAR
jgi:flagellar hook assembly protein FlgD